jgi:hypothetical protein
MTAPDSDDAGEIDARNRTMKWSFATLLAIQAHFAVSYLVPLDAQAQTAFWGLLPWAWPWRIGDHGPLGQMTATGFPITGFFLAVTAGSVLILAALAVLRIWVPFGWWRPLAIAGAVMSVLLMMLFFGATKLLPIGTALVILAAALDYWTPLATR